MGLQTYKRKRDFSRTPEPRGKSLRKTAGRIYCIQKHAATRLHYDFRLEWGGVLLSWAVPKGPSLDPKDKRLAVHVEDHPVEYASFEGIIPKGEYGGGSVLLWDRGTWSEEGDVAAGLARGRLKFRLHGEKLRGAWMLVRMGRASEEDGKENWLLVKEKDEEADARGKRDIVAERPESVASGRLMEEIGGGSERRWKSNRPARGSAARPRATSAPKRSPSAAPSASGIKGARKAALPERVHPQLATLVSEVPEGEEWLHELKYDGYRALCRVEEGGARFFTREGNDWTARFGDLAREAAELPVRRALLDGEVVVLQPDGTTSFQALQNVLSRENAGALVFYAFDLLYLDGYDLRGAVLGERKRLLEQLLPGNSGAVRYSDHVVGNGSALYSRACEHKLEGIVSKRADRPYRSGRGRDWLKIKCLASQEFVIGGFTDPAGARKGLGSLLLGAYDEGGALRYAGRVGTGFTDEMLRDLRARLEALEVEKPPFVNPPRGADARGAHWVEPRLVAAVEFTEWTRDGVLRHPTFRGLREDKRARAVVRERPADEPQSASREGSSVAGVALTHPDRVLYPDAGITKLDLARYYESVAERILPYVRERPLTLVRCPDGHHKECFFQKHATESVPRAVGRLRLREGKGMATYLQVDSAEGLVSLVQIGVLELHPWGSHAGRIEQPDRMIFDLDPGPGVEWPSIVDGARRLRELLADLGLEAFAKTTGGK